MKVLVVYDSVYGNTKQIAQAIGKTLEAEHDIEVARAAEVKENQLLDLQVLFIGSPTHGGRFTEAIQDFLAVLSAQQQQVITIAAFDTRTCSKGIVGWLERRFGHAAPRIVEVLESQDKIFNGKQEGFIVTGRKGPLKEGEVERAEIWAKEILQISTY